MTTLYVDTSVLASIILKDRDFSILSNSDTVISASLTEAELFAFSKRENLPESVATKTLELVDLVFPKESLKKELQRVFNTGYCKGSDAFHLATALHIDPNTSEIKFITADKKQELLARKLGFKTS